jgi:thioredoxin-like negative regulator of GroEL
MIERLLAAESALADGELEIAGRLFAQVAEADARNAIAVVGLARIAMRDGRAEEARGLLARALAIDPDEAAAQRLIRELYVSTPAPEPMPAPEPVPVPAPEPAPGPAQEPTLATEPGPAQPAARRLSLFGRLRAWLAGRGRRA